MIFETLSDSAKRGELLLIRGGICHFHLRRDGQITIREIISTRPGAGGEMLEMLKQTAVKAGATSLFARCPDDLPANGWYAHEGFLLSGSEVAKSGRKLNKWRLPL